MTLFTQKIILFNEQYIFLCETLQIFRFFLRQGESKQYFFLFFAKFYQLSIQNVKSKQSKKKFNARNSSIFKVWFWHCGNTKTEVNFFVAKTFLNCRENNILSSLAYLYSLFHQFLIF
jgi:hypothetical protein